MKIRILTVLALIAIILVSSCEKGNYNAKLKTEIDSVSYAIGVTIGYSLQDLEMETLNVEAFASAVQDVSHENELKITRDDAIALLNYFFMEKQFVEVKKEGEDFLAENKTNEGVITLESGLQYKVLTEGTGPVPKATDVVKAHYHGTLIDGMVFDSSMERGEPIQIPVGGVIRGWQEALQLMPVGSKWMLYIPQELAYGANPQPGGPIQPYSALIFEIELLEIVDQTEN
jgi:FKBP-type peptidyl-prolyl cis-trans isomerase FklB